MKREILEAQAKACSPPDLFYELLENIEEMTSSELLKFIEKHDVSFSMPRYQMAAARERIHGYYLPRPHETTLEGRTAAFKRAQVEAVTHLKQALKDTESLTPEQFFQGWLAVLDTGK